MWLPKELIHHATYFDALTGNMGKILVHVQCAINLCTIYLTNMR